MQLTELLVPTWRQMLQTLVGLVDKAQAQLGAHEAEALPGARLAPDMFPLATQLRFAAYQVQDAVYRLRGEPAPERLEVLAAEARAGDERLGSLADARARLDEALAFLAGLAPDSLDPGAGRPIALDLPNGMVFDMTGDQYARDWALPQFYFHVIAAYAILRNHGVEIGKADYVPYMLAYLRPGTFPGP
jgi:hypothetical protein